MTPSGIYFHWKGNYRASFRTGVSLHSHTLHSRETMEFIQRCTKKTPWLGKAIRKQEAKYRAIRGKDLDYSNAWWTPPLSPLQAYELEAGQVRQLLNCDALVSLSDHDSIEAGAHLQMLEGKSDFPISVEWTVPFGETFFHIGLHNLPPATAADIMRRMEEITESENYDHAVELMAALSENPQTLIIFNHPMWDEGHIGADRHYESVQAFLTRMKPFLHAFELNGLRPWKENQKVVWLAESEKMPLISGGDRHGREPNACINLTNARTFAEFVSEVRVDGHSEVLFMPQYREPLRMRILENMFQIMQDDENHSLGWVRWSDRVFYRTDEGEVHSLATHWKDGMPSVVTQFVSLMSLMRHRRVQSALRFALNDKEEFAL